MSTGDHFNADEVIDEEYRQILARRIKALADTPVDPFRHGTPERKALDDALKPDGNDERGRDAHLCERNLVGLALSGGGIRSATFGLGVIQGLADLGLLKFCDYLSTVSGGGYIGSWLTAWIKREGDLNNVVEQLRPLRTDQAEAQRGFQSLRTFIPPGTIQENEPETICHLREYSNYLSPRLSVFSSDSWTLVTIYLRNLLANLLALLPALLFLLLLVRAFTALLARPVSLETGTPWGGAAGALLLAGLASFTRSLALLTDREQLAESEPGAGKWWLRLTVMCLLAGSFLTVWLTAPCALKEITTRPAETQGGFLSMDPLLPASGEWIGRFEGWKWLAGIQPEESASTTAGSLSPSRAAWQFNRRVLIGLVVSSATIHLALALFLRQPWRVVAAGFSGAAVGALFYLALVYLLWPYASAPEVVITGGPPLLLLIFITGNIAETALLGQTASEQEREWRSRLNAWELILAVGWLLVCGISLYGTRWMNQLHEYVRAGLTAGWLTTAVGGLLAAKSSRTRESGQKSWQNALSLITPYVFLAGLICLISSFAGFLVRQTDQPGAEDVLLNPDWDWLAGSLLVSLIVAAGASCCVSVNEFSLNAMYANRLTRCFLGASRRKRQSDWLGIPGRSHGPEWKPNRVTGFDPNDDLPLNSLQIGKTPESYSDSEKPEHETTYWGPVPLINTALNLQAGDRLAWQERKAESYLLSPQFCGAKSLGYRETGRYAAGHAATQPLPLGRAVAISGAAASPSMGYHSSPAVSALLTAFNVRLGWWLPNPRLRQEKLELDQWKSCGPNFLLYWLAIELFSLTSSNRRYVNISDGGHFENLGVYELIRRRCRLIIAVDAGADPDYQFEDLGGLIRKCRTDFGVDIEIDVNALKPEPGAQLSRQHCVAGTIRYDHLDPTAPVGTLIYIKPSMTGDEPGDIQHYARQHASFPHQPTLDQFFSESQFESYRQLGYHCVVDTLDSIAKRLKASDIMEPGSSPASPADFPMLLGQAGKSHKNVVENLIYATRTRWLDAPSVISPDFLKSTDDFVMMQENLRDRSVAGVISRQLYPDLPWTTPDGEYAIRAEDVHSTSLMLQVMENAFVGLNLQQTYANSLNSGWINLFQRWSGTPLLQRYWPLLRNEYSRDFVYFCERELSLKADYSNDLENHSTNRCPLASYPERIPQSVAGRKRASSELELSLAGRLPVQSHDGKRHDRRATRSLVPPGTPTKGSSE